MTRLFNAEQRGVGRAALVLALALGCGAFLMHPLDPGLWRDDYSWGVRDPVTGGWSWRAIADLPGSWRPLSVLAVRTILTVQGDSLWFGRALAAAAHALAAWMLWRLMRDLAIGPRAAAAAMLGFVFMPWAFEVGLWPAAVPTGIALALWLWLASIAVRIADGRLGPRWAAAAGGIALVIPCWNEQPATGVAAIPLIFLAAGRGPWRERLRRSALTTGLCCAACGVYVAALVLTSRPELRGGAGSYTPLTSLSGRAWDIGSRVADLLAGATARDMALGSIRTGARELGTWRGAAWLTVVVIAGGAGLRHWARGGGPDPQGAGRWGWVGLLGIVLFVLAWMPVIIIQRAWVEPRLMYAPMAGLLIAGAALSRAAGAGERARWIVAVAVPLAAAALAVGMLGFATLLRDRARMDREEAAALHRVWPEPGAGTVFVAARADQTAGGTGYRGFDRLEQSVWSWDLYGTCMIRRVYGRDDLFFVRYWPGGVLRMDAAGLRVSLIERPAYERRRLAERVVPWSQVVVFEIDGSGGVRIVDGRGLSGGKKGAAP